MLSELMPGVLIHESGFLQSNAVVVQEGAGLLLIDPGITSEEMASLGRDLERIGSPVVVGFSTHPHWDHLLWHTAFGPAPRYGTALADADVKAFLSQDDWRSQAVPMLPPELSDEIPLDDLFGGIIGLPAGTEYLPWEGSRVRIVEHAGHAAGSAVVLVEEAGLLVAGDMVSDILVPFLDFDAADPVGDYLAALDLLESLAGEVTAFVPGHGSVGDAAELRSRIERDRAYVHGLRSGGGGADPRLASGPERDRLSSVHDWQSQQIGENAKGHVSAD